MNCIEASLMLQQMLCCRSFESWQIQIDSRVYKYPSDLPPLKFYSRYKSGERCSLGCSGRFPGGSFDASLLTVLYFLSLSSVFDAASSTMESYEIYFRQTTKRRVLLNVGQSLRAGKASYFQSDPHEWKVMENAWKLIDFYQLPWHMFSLFDCVVCAAEKLLWAQSII